MPRIGRLGLEAAVQDLAGRGGEAAVRNMAKTQNLQPLVNFARTTAFDGLGCNISQCLVISKQPRTH